MIAEESTAWPGVTASVDSGGLGFDLKWNMGWMHDMLEYFSLDPFFRSHHQNKLTFAMFYAYTERFLLPLSHDEVVHGKRSLLSKMPGDMWKQCANLRALYGLMYAFPGKKLLFMGGEFGQWTEWNFEKELDWVLLEFERHRGIRQWVRDLNALYVREPALHELDFSPEGFEWIDFSDEAGSTVAFERKSVKEEDSIVCVFNFIPDTRTGYRVGVRESGRYIELLNSDSSAYGGGNVGNLGEVEALSEPHHGREYSLLLTLPPLSAIFLKRLVSAEGESVDRSPEVRGS
jgi:1,4-alpha-glucan branching enzyme